MATPVGAPPGARPTHDVPRLDAPERVGPVPVAQAKWLGAGIASGPCASVALSYLGGYDPVGVWDLPLLWLFWLVALTGCLVLAFVRPGGLHAGQWVAVWADYSLRPGKAVWK